ncbi:hypothetical protein M5K25_028134 [Dendrobium thyrsiflorum]|uniref:Uncharacterized protein n=1 Tax=Dendrobium thyrsiflorum TaxID=117978 RepID=A0ABD0TVR3_DENTH
MITVDAADTTRAGIRDGFWISTGFLGALEIHQFAGLCSLRFATVAFGSAACVTLLLLCAGFRWSRVPVCELLGSGTLYLPVDTFVALCRFQEEQCTSSLWKEQNEDVDFLFRHKSLPKFTCSICDAKSGSDSSSSGKYRSSSELQSIGNTIMQVSTTASLTHSSFTNTFGITGMTRQTSVGRESASAFSSVSPTLSPDIKSANLIGCLTALASRSVFPFAGTFRRQIPEPGVQSSELCIPELIGIRAPFSSEGELGPQVVGPRKISLAHQRSYFSLPTLGQQIYSGWEYWLQVPEQADLMGAQASSAEP